MRHELHLDAAAYDALTAFMRWIEPQLAAEGTLASADGWTQKLAGHTARIAGLLHMATGDPTHALTQPVGVECMDRAIRLAREYLIPHARAALRGIGADPALEDARRVLAWLQRNQRASFTRRDLCANLRARFEQPRDAEPALKLLCDMGYIRLDDQRPRQRGRTPSATYIVHAAALTPDPSPPYHTDSPVP